MEQNNSHLIVAADLQPDGRDLTDYWQKHEDFAKSIRNTGVTVKLNSALRLYGYKLLELYHQFGLKTFADLKLIDIGNTLEADGGWLNEYEPAFVTVMCAAGADGLRKLNRATPRTAILGVTVLTTFHEEDCDFIHGRPIEQTVDRLAALAKDAELDGVVSSPKELEFLVPKYGGELTFTTPAVRPEWNLVENDDQNPDRVMTPRRALDMGATRLVIGRPITQSSSPRDAILRTLEEMYG